MSKRKLSLLAGAVALAFSAVYWAPRLVAELPQTRTISLHNIHTKETITVEYKRDGKYVPEAMEQINWLMRDWRRNEKTRMDPELIDLLWEIHTELGSKEPIHIISGYRSPATNEMLRRTRGGQAKQSRHMLGKAADVHFPDVPLRKLRYSALVRERGGVGYYPTSAIPFVHVDTDRVRAWPRLPRYELALLFPDGRTKHIPADGKPLTPADVHEARAKHQDLAIQVAAYHELRKSAAQRATQIAAANVGTRKASQPARVAPKPELQRAPTPVVAQAKLEPKPKLVAEPRLAARPSRPSDADRMKLAQMAALASLPLEPANLLKASFGSDTKDSANTTLSQSKFEAAPQQSAELRLAALNTDEFGRGSEQQLGRFGWSRAWHSDRRNGDGPTSWVAAPEFDEEHPEELFYRPFPIAPYLTETPSPDDPALAKMQHPDVAKTLEFLDDGGDTPVMRLRPEPQTVQLLWAQQFRGEAVPLASIFGERANPPRGMANRPVRLSAR
ncbi:MAG: hypothetical protein DIU63_02075 [Proteobacteria bacterium]|nr:MAG: hypothetical protein DIU63_02075 [Pseudomonadota bacterium]